MDIDKLSELIKLSMTVSGSNECAPFPFVDKVAKESLSPSGYDAWTNILVALANVSREERVKIAKLLIHHNTKLWDIVEISPTQLRLETADTVKFLIDNPEFKNPMDFDEFRREIIGND